MPEGHAKPLSAVPERADFVICQHAIARRFSRWLAHAGGGIRINEIVGSGPAEKCPQAREGAIRLHARTSSKPFALALASPGLIVEQFEHIALVDPRQRPRAPARQHIMLEDAPPFAGGLRLQIPVPASEVRGDGDAAVVVRRLLRRGLAELD